MDWDLKMPLWDLAELERDAVRSIGSVVVGPSGGCGGGFIALQADGLDCSVDLKLGGLGDFRPGKKCKDESRVPETFPAAVVSPSAPLKRPRPSGNGVQSACCSVEGCQADLSKCREYHRRHKVCEVHSKTPVVIVGGQEQRFCQQCSRFHLLPEFDEVKRSCRKRLDGHNRRRRKPQPDTAKPGTFPNHQGSRFSACPQIFPTAASETSWAGIVKAEENTLFLHCSSQLANRGRHFSGLHSYNKERTRFPFLQQSEATLTSKNILGTSMDQAHHSAFTLSGSSSNNSKMFSHGLTQVFHSDCALSLLSSPIQTPGMNKSPMMPPPDRITVGQPLVSCFQYDGFVQNSCSQASKSMSPIGFSCSTMEDEQVGGILVSDANNADIHCQSMLHVSGEGFSGRTSQTLPFSWH